MLGEWYLPPGKCQAISTITEGIISISHPAPLSSQTRIPQTSSPLVDKSQATQAALLQIRRSEAGPTKPTAAHPSGGPVAGGAIGTSGMPLTASGRERPPDSDACKQAPRSWVS